MIHRHARRSFLMAALVVGCGLVAPSVGAQTIQGVLLDGQTDRPIDLGLVMMFTVTGDSVTATMTNEDGFFSVTSREPGSFLLLASALGYREKPEGVFDLGVDGQMTVEYRVVPAPLPLDELIVSLDRPVLEHKLVRNGFVRRAQRERGVFITPYDIENAPALSTEDLFRGVSDVVVRPSSGIDSYLGDQVMVRNRNGSGYCAPLLFVDGVRVQSGQTDGLTLSSIVSLSNVEAAELYRGATEVPPEYNITQGGNTCGVLLIWTKAR